MRQRVTTLHLSAHWPHIAVTMMAFLLIGCLHREPPDPVRSTAASWVRARIPKGWEMVRGAENLDMVVIRPAAAPGGKRQPVHISIIRTEIVASEHMNYEQAIAADELLLKEREPGGIVVRKPIVIGGQRYVGAVVQVTRKGVTAERWVVSVLGQGVVYTVLFWDHTGTHWRTVKSILATLALDGAWTTVRMEGADG